VDEYRAVKVIVPVSPLLRLAVPVEPDALRLLMTIELTIPLFTNVVV
jgi:hypothetical protein